MTAVQIIVAAANQPEEDNDQQKIFRFPITPQPAAQPQQQRKISAWQSRLLLIECWLEEQAHHRRLQ